MSVKWLQHVVIDMSCEGDW